MINNVVLVSDVQHSIVTHGHGSLLCQILSAFKFLHHTEQSCLCYTEGPYWLSIFFLNIIFIFHCARFSLLHGLSLAAVSGGYSLVVMDRFLIVVASLVVVHGLSGT